METNTPGNLWHLIDKLTSLDAQREGQRYPQQDATAICGKNLNQILDTTGETYIHIRWYKEGGTPGYGGHYCLECLADPEFPLYLLAATEL